MLLHYFSTESVPAIAAEVRSALTAVYAGRESRFRGAVEIPYGLRYARGRGYRFPELEARTATLTEWITAIAEYTSRPVFTLEIDRADWRGQAERRNAWLEAERASLGLTEDMPGINQRNGWSRNDVYLTRTLPRVYLYELYSRRYHHGAEFPVRHIRAFRKLTL